MLRTKLFRLQVYTRCGRLSCKAEGKERSSISNLLGPHIEVYPLVQPQKQWEEAGRANLDGQRDDGDGSG